MYADTIQNRRNSFKTQNTNILSMRKESNKKVILVQELNMQVNFHIVE